MVRKDFNSRNKVTSPAFLLHSSFKTLLTVKVSQYSNISGMVSSILETAFFCQRSGDFTDVKNVKTSEIQQNRNVEDIRQHKFSVAPMMEYTGRH